jgi:hypothetical protein
VSDGAKTQKALQRAYPWLTTIWIGFVLVAFFVIRILGSGLAHRLLSHFKLRFLQ